MAALRRHCIVTVCGSLSVLAGACVLTLYLCASPARAAEPEQVAVAIDPATYSDLQILRRELSLTNEDLAAAGLSQESAEAVLRNMLAWHAEKKGELETAKKAVTVKDRELAAAVRWFNVGPDPDRPAEAVEYQRAVQQIPVLKEELSAAKEAYQALVQGAVPRVEASMTAEQVDVWRTAIANASAPPAYRYVPNLEPGQVKELMKATRARERKAVGAQTPEEKANVQREFDDAFSSVLTSRQRDMLAAAEANARQHMAEVMKASDNVLPVPKELRIPVQVAPESER